MANDDLISRAAAVESLGECPYNWNDWPEEIQAVDDWESHKKALEELPAVDAAPIVHAEWVKENDRVNHWHCSNCDNAFGQVVYFYKFCPFCGAATTVKDQSEDDGWLR